MTTANKITIVRILLVPLFVVQVLYYAEDGAELHRLLAILSFAAAAVSDGVDGYIARRYHQRSHLGSILDPLADKMLLVSGIVLLSLDHYPYLHRLPLYLAGTVLSRDLLLLLGMAVIYYIGGNVAVRPHWIGKVATVLQMVAVFWTLLKWHTGWQDHFLHLCVVAATLCTGISGLIYLRVGVQQLSASPSSSPVPEPQTSAPHQPFVTPVTKASSSPVPEPQSGALLGGGIGLRPHPSAVEHMAGRPEDEPPPAAKGVTDHPKTSR